MTDGLSESSKGKICLACFFEQEGKLPYENFPHTCGVGPVPNDQDIERIHKAAQELVRADIEKTEEELANEVEKVEEPGVEEVSASTKLHTLAKATLDKIRSEIKSRKAAFDRQVGGDHYLGMSIQPGYFCMVNRLPAAESHIIKYMCRWRKKGGIQDLKKAQHWLEMLIACEQEREYEKRRT